MLKRFTVSMEDSLLEDFDGFIPYKQKLDNITKQIKEIKEFIKKPYKVRF